MELQGNAVLILPDNVPEKTITGLYNPLNQKEKPQKGVVIDCGPVCTQVKKEDRVYYSRKSSSIINIDDVEYDFVTEHQIYLIEEKS